MTDGSTDDQQPATTAINVQRIESGYFDHLQSLRDQVPVGNYLISSRTMRWALISMAAVSVVFFVTFPLTMFIRFSPVVILVYMLAFVGFGWVFYDRVLEPNEGTEEWRE
ncbi:hypothetical protein GJ633_02650 [Halorubrum sp. CBA1125]|uniref:hypothetical protein n=1 Tax=Halorubrum sp. CBA1125 TaxID=2668072 RepID=UPI0012E92849|nr:hypothetical protein [Halorubrum sp. CBA1125]MUW13679.1 hypothetical protein [Halorubrum sp. CBA1125]